MQVGLVDWTGGFLSGAGHGDGVSAQGSSLGKKQTWKLRVATEQGKQSVVALIGHQGQHLLVEADGVVRCGRPAADQRSQFLLEVHPSGAWTLQQLESRKFLESDGEDVFCVARGLTAHHLWMPQLAEHVHVVLFHPSSRLYARTDPELNRVWVDAPVPYLEECGFLLRFRKGACHLETSNHKFVSRAEKLAKVPSTETAFHLNLKPGCLAFLADMEGRILYPRSSRGLLCLGDHPAESEQWFVIKRCPQWVSLKTRANRYISVISGRGKSFWSLTPERTFSPWGKLALNFYLEIQGNNLLAITAPNGYYLRGDQEGCLVADSEEITQDCLWEF